MSQPKNWTIQGAGAIQAQGFVTQSRPIWILSHPHPAFGGSMTHKIIDLVFRRAVEQQMSVVRYNFRGVDQSQGKYDQGGGEVDDLKAVVNHVQDTFNISPTDIALLGYSFGSYISAMVASNMPSLHSLHLVAPPTQMKPFPSLPSAYPIHIWMPENDQYTRVEHARTYADSLKSNAQWHLVPNTDHFFVGGTARWTRDFFETVGASSA